MYFYWFVFWYFGVGIGGIVEKKLENGEEEVIGNSLIEKV